MSMSTWDVFISHASEDSVDVAVPLAAALSRAGLRVWLDKQQLEVGDSLRQKIDAGLAQSRFGVLVLSERFFEKRWTLKELDGLVAREDLGSKVLLPVWHGIDQRRVAEFSPTLAGLLAARTTDGIDTVAAQIARAVLNPANQRFSPIERLLDMIGSEPTSDRIADFTKHHRDDGATADDDDEIRGWTVGLSCAFAAYVYFSAVQGGVTAPDYKGIAVMVAQPAQRLGLSITIPKQRSYSVDTALRLGERLTSELSVQHTTGVACLFDFLWRVILLLQAADNDPVAASEQNRMQSTLSRAAQNADMLNEYTSGLIRALASGSLTEDEMKREHGRFIRWAYNQVTGTTQSTA
jgi:hypothetical protein